MDPAEQPVATDRTPRVLETREETARTEIYKPPSMLPDPLPRDGVAHRWICTRAGGEDTLDLANYRFAEGYVPCKAKDYPEFANLNLANKKGEIESGGLLLCKMSKERSDSRDKHFQDKADNSLRAVDAELASQQDARMPQFKNRNSRVSFGRL